MSDISSTIRLNDQMSDPLKKISGNVERLVGQLEKMGATSKSVPDDTSKYNSMADSLNNLFVAAGGYKVVQLVGSAFSASAKAAIEYESAVTGVYKTVDGTKEQLQGLSDAVRQLSLELPSTTTEIAGVMEAAGQLGIATENVASFSKTMIDLGNSTNLTAEQAATSLAKFANITGMSAQDYDRLGAVIVDLGNNFATTEADIVNMSTYLTSAATVAGLAETDIMGLSAAMISMGINAEAGGSSMSKLISQMQTAVEVGGDDLKAFASVADMTAEEFTAKWGSDAVGALQAFIGGLNDVERNGKSMSVILKDMDLDDIRMSNMIKALASGSDTLTAAVSKANAAWEENTALTNEADKRYKTLDSRMQMLNNAFDNLKIAVGDTLTPALGLGVDAATGFTNSLTKMAEICPELVGGMSGFYGTLSLAAGGFTALAPAITAASTAMQAFNLTTKSLGIGIGIAGGVAVLGGILGAISGYASRDLQGVEDYNGTLEQCAREIENANLAHEKAIALYGEESDAVKSLESQLSTLEAQYKKGGGSIGDFAERIKASKESFDKFTQNYKDRISSINDTQTSELAMIAQFEALSNKTVKTNSDLEIMGKLADHLNEEFHCNIVVDYNLGDVVGFDRDLFIDQVKEKAETNRLNYVTSVLAGDEDTLMTDYQNAYKTLKERADTFDINEMFADSTRRHSRNPFLPLLSDSLTPYTVAYEKQIKDANDKLNDYKSKIKGLYSDLGYEPEEAEKQMKDYVRILEDTSGYRAKMPALPEMDTGLSKLMPSTSNSHFEMDANGIPSYVTKDIDTMTSAADEAEKANDAIKTSLTGMSEELMNTAQAYDEAYRAAYKSFSGQFGLFEDAEKTYKDAVSEIMKTNDDKADNDTTVLQSLIDNANTQKEYFDKITESLETISSVDLSKVGMTAAEWDAFNDHMAELSASGTEGAAGVNAFADAIENGQWDKVKEAAKAYEDAKTASANASGKVANEVSNVEQMMDKTQKAIENTLTNVGLQAPTAHDKAKSVVDQLAAGVSAGYYNLSAQVSAVESLMARLASFGVSAEAPKKSSTTSSAPSGGGSTTTSTSVAKYHDATGTTSAFPGLTLVGENGPELIDMTGGEVVYNASQTAKMMEQIGGISRSLGMEHGIGSLDSYSFHTFDTPKEEDNELRLSDSDREYLISLGEREALNAATATTQNINFEMKDFTIKNESDLDGIIDYLAKGLREALVTSAEGVHK